MERDALPRSQPYCAAATIGSRSSFRFSMVRSPTSQTRQCISDCHRCISVADNGRRRDGRLPASVSIGYRRFHFWMNLRARAVDAGLCPRHSRIRNGGCHDLEWRAGSLYLAVSNAGARVVYVSRHRGRLKSMLGTCNPKWPPRRASHPGIAVGSVRPPSLHHTDGVLVEQVERDRQQDEILQ